MKILFITTEWPTEKQPHDVPFLVEYVRALKNSGVEIEVFHFKGKGNPLNYLKAWLAIRKSPYWQSADILHAHWGQSGVLGLFSKKPLIITFHGSDLQGIVNDEGKYSVWGKVLVRISKWIAGQADHVIVVSKHLIKLLPNTNLKVSVIPMGVDLSLFKPRDQIQCRHSLGLDPNKVYILFASNPTRPEKRFHLAVDAVKCLQEKIPDLSAELFVINQQPHHKMPEFLNAGNVLLLTSSHEGSPVIIREALACNLPIVSVDVGDVKEKIQSVQGCFVCSDDSPVTIAENLTRALKSPGQINGLQAVQEYSWEAISQQTISVYQSIL